MSRFCTVCGEIGHTAMECAFSEAARDSLDRLLGTDERMFEKYGIDVHQDSDDDDWADYCY